MYVYAIFKYVVIVSFFLVKPTRLAIVQSLKLAMASYWILLLVLQHVSSLQFGSFPPLPIIS